jgi:hypothetical protein
MARIRTIKPEFFRHEGLFELERECCLPVRVAFAGLWTAADREGRFKWSPKTLKLDCLPFDECDFSRVLDALSTRGFIVKYVVDGREFGFIPSWNEHQVINNRESESVLPEPTESSIESNTSTRAPRVTVASPTPLVQVQGEGKGREGKGTRVNALFDDFWKAYPKKTAKDDARKAFEKRKPDADMLGQMLAALAVQKASPAWTKDGGQFIPNPATWLNGGRWQDESGSGAATGTELFAGAI